MAMTRKIVTAGPLVREVLYPRIGRGDSDRVRAAKSKASSEARQRMNDRVSWQKCEMMIAANFVPGDPVVCLTYDDRHLPESRKQVSRHITQFRAELQKLMGRKTKLRILWSIEHLHGEKRWHVHLICNFPGDCRKIAAAWRRGLIYAEPFCVDAKKNHETLARYICKESRDKVGLRAWSYSRSCSKPEVETWTVPDDTQLSVPKGAAVIEQVRDRREYGRFEFVKYRYAATVRPHYRRRKKSRK